MESLCDSTVWQACRVARVRPWSLSVIAWSGKHVVWPGSGNGVSVIVQSVQLGQRCFNTVAGEAACAAGLSY